MRSAVAQRLSCLLRGGNMTCREGMRAFVKPAYQHESLPTPAAEDAPRDAFDTDAAALRRWREMQAAGVRGAGPAAASQPHAAPRPQTTPSAPGAATGGGPKAHAAAASLDARVPAERGGGARAAALARCGELLQGGGGRAGQAGRRGGRGAGGGARARLAGRGGGAAGGASRRAGGQRRAH